MSEILRKANDYFSVCSYSKALDLYLKIENNKNYEKLLNQDVLLKIAQSYLQLELYDKAIKYFNKVLNYYLKINDLEKALAIAKQIVNIDPDNTETMLIIAKLYKSMNLVNDAAKYYRIVAKHYELSGLNYKVLEVVQILKDMGLCTIDDAINMAIHDYYEGSFAKFRKNIDEIILDLKKGNEYVLLEKAYLLALKNDKNDLIYLKELATLLFHSSKLTQALKLSYYGISLYPDNSDFWLILVKSLAALSYKELSLSILNKLINKKIVLKELEDLALFEDFYNNLKSIEYKKTNETILDYQYLEKDNFTSVDHDLISIKLKEEDLKNLKININKTEIYDKDRNLKLPSAALSALDIIDLLIAESLYDKALEKISDLLKEYPEIQYLKTLFLKCNYLVKQNNKSQMSFNNYDQEDLYQYLDPIDQDFVNTFHNLLLKKIDLKDKNLVFDCAISYFSMEIYDKAYELFKKLGESLGVSPVIYKIFSYHKFNKFKDNKYLSELDLLLTKTLDNLEKCEILYYYALIMEGKANTKEAKSLYNKILLINPDYRDIDFRISVLGS